MKGIVFTEFLDLVEEKFGLEVADKIIEQSDLSTGGAYTAIGTYDHAELVQLVVRLSEETDIEVGALVKVFGEYLFGRLVASHPVFLEGITSAEEMLRKVHDVIHVEVKKLYPKAELPAFKCSDAPDGRLNMDYESPRGFGDLAEGLMTGCASHFGEEIDIEREDTSGGAGTSIRFTLGFRKAA